MKKFSEMFVTAVCGGIIGFALSFYQFNEKINHLVYEMEARPIVAVADYITIAKEFQEGADPKDLNKAVVKYTRQVNQLGQQGVLVLSSESISSAPEHLVIKLDQ